LIVVVKELMTKAQISDSKVMTVNEWSVNGDQPFPCIVFSCSGVATPEDWRHGALSPTWWRRHHDTPMKLLDIHAGRIGKLVATESRQAMSDRWAVAVVDSSSAFGGRRRRRRSHGPPTDRRRDVCRERTTCPTDETATGVATAHLWRGRCRRSGREPTLHQAPIRPRRRSGVVVRPQHVRIHLPPESTE